MKMCPCISKIVGAHKVVVFGENGIEVASDDAATSSAEVRRTDGNLM
jgi:hypothetical protein